MSNSTASPIPSLPAGPTAVATSVEISPEEHKRQLFSKDLSRFKYVEVYPSYNQEDIQRYFGCLSSSITNFRELIHSGYFCDKTHLIKVGGYSRCSLLTAPPGYGETSAISMLNYHYDIDHADEFNYLFYCTTAAEGDWYPNHFLMLNYDFKELNVDDPNDYLNEGLKKFVEKYQRFKKENGKKWEDFVDPNPVETFQKVIELMYEKHELAVCIDNYDFPYWTTYRTADENPDRHYKLTCALGDFFTELVQWHAVVTMIFLAGEEPILFNLPSTIDNVTYNILLKQWITDPFCGFNKQDVRSIERRIKNTFHSLDLENLAETFFESEEGKVVKDSWFNYSLYSISSGRSLQRGRSMLRRYKRLGFRITGRRMKSSKTRLCLSSCFLVYFLDGAVDCVNITKQMCQLSYSTIV